MGALAPELASSLRRIATDAHDRVARSPHRRSSALHAPTPRLPCEVTPDGSIVVVGGGVDGGVCAFDIRTGVPVASDARSTIENGTHQRVGHVSGHTSDTSDTSDTSPPSRCRTTGAFWSPHPPTRRSRCGPYVPRVPRATTPAARGPRRSRARGSGYRWGGGVGVSMGDAMGRAAREAERHPATGAARGYAPPEYHAGERSAVAHALAAGVSKGRRGFREGDDHDPVARIVRERARERASPAASGAKAAGAAGAGAGAAIPGPGRRRRFAGRISS